MFQIRRRVHNKVIGIVGSIDLPAVLFFFNFEQYFNPCLNCRGCGPLWNVTDLLMRLLPARANIEMKLSTINMMTKQNKTKQKKHNSKIWSWQKLWLDRSSWWPLPAPNSFTNLIHVFLDVIRSSGERSSSIERRLFHRSASGSSRPHLKWNH